MTGCERSRAPHSCSRSKEEGSSFLAFPSFSLWRASRARMLSSTRTLIWGRKVCYEKCLSSMWLFFIIILVVGGESCCVVVIVVLRWSVPDNISLLLRLEYKWFWNIGRTGVRWRPHTCWLLSSYSLTLCGKVLYRMYSRFPSSFKTKLAQAELSLQAEHTTLPTILTDLNTYCIKHILHTFGA